MRYAAALALAAAAAITIATLATRGTGPGSGSRNVAVAQEVPESLMIQKLDQAKELLGAIAIGDFERMILASKELQRISLEARWSQPHSPSYAALGEEFRTGLGRLIASAESQNIDSASLNYVQVVLTCVQCHKIVREGEQIAQQAGHDDTTLLQRAMVIAGN